MKIGLKLLSIILIVMVAFIAGLNQSTISLNLWKGVAYNINLIYIIWAVLYFGMTAGFIWAASLYVISQDKLKEYQRKLEKTSVNAECDNSKVEVLEAKIEVLEKALKAALEKNNE